MKKIFFTITFLALLLNSFSQERAFKIYTAKGKKTTFKKIRKALSPNTVVLFGELHNNPISHWLQIEIIKAASENFELILGAEMIETDNQVLLNSYLSNEINFKTFRKTARLWQNYTTDYAPLIDFAKKENIKFIATNIPRRYANRVYKNGLNSLDTLTQQEKTWITPLPFPFNINLSSYQKILTEFGDHGTPELVLAQAIKDATMAHFIFKSIEKNHLFIHFNGTYHSDNYEGIYWYLKQKDSKLKIVTLSTVSQENIHKLDLKNKGKADFIICVDDDMTKTY